MVETIKVTVQKVAEALETYDVKDLKKELANADRVTTADQQTPMEPGQSAILHKANVRVGRSR